MTLRTPAFNDARTYGFEWLRLAAELALQEGVIGSGDLKATAAAAGLQRVDVAAGIAVIKGDTGTPGTGLSHGLYVAVNDASIANAVTFAASHATLPRIDQVILRVRDTSDLGGAADDLLLEAVTGTATGGATLDNRTGAAALPNDAIRLADVLIPAASSAVVAGNVRDRRQWARGAHAFLKYVVGNKTGTNTTLAAVDTTNLQARMEFSGAPVVYKAIANGSHTAAQTYLGIIWDSVNYYIASGIVTTVIGNLGFAFDDAGPGVGSHLVALGAGASAGGTWTLSCNGVSPLVLAVSEDIRPSAVNT